jgi:ribonucleoside-diphosphate reductase alpha chain
VIQRHLTINGADKPVAEIVPTARKKPRACPRCGAAALVRSEGCDKCLECGHSKCG